ncbi:MAG: phospho-N-acetylmuramoyl-pentapeptide-transferase [Planctomycetes bacterium]|nr:phospho-N-acetylmuramoyl-pentapeptide-transferase [Planctomycetota bacterium]
MFASLLESPFLRASLAAATALAAVAFLIPWLANAARRRQYGDRDDKSDSDTLNQLHKGKRRTPIVGGIAMLGALCASSLTWASWSEPTVWILLLVAVGLAALGLWDDVAKTFGAKRTQGLSPRAKLRGQLGIGLGLGALLLLMSAYGWGEGVWSSAALTELSLPCTRWALPLGSVGFLLFTALLLTGSSNAVNLTDGLDGLAGGCSLVAYGVYFVLLSLAADPILSARLGLTAAPGAGEAAIVLGAQFGALTGFLVFNRHPAQVFMGDTGSLPLGGLLAAAAVLCKQELLLALVGGVFVAEALSVMLQVASFKLTGRRVFRCAPLHHHFEFKGWPETLVVNRFHAAALILGGLGLWASLGGVS